MHRIPSIVAISLVVSVDVKHHDYLQYAFLQSTLTGRKTPVYLLTYLLTFKVLFSAASHTQCQSFIPEIQRHFDSRMERIHGALILRGPKCESLDKFALMMMIAFM